MSGIPSGTITYPPIKDFGLIGDLHTAALVSKNGSIDWCCWPVDFNGETLSVKGKARLHFFRPEKEEERIQFKYLVEAGDGKAFYDFLSKKKLATALGLRGAQRIGWFVTYEKSPSSMIWIHWKLLKMSLHIDYIKLIRGHFTQK